jgi:hypothetical protein
LRRFSVGIDLSPKSHPSMSRIRSSFEPGWRLSASPDFSLHIFSIGKAQSGGNQNALCIRGRTDPGVVMMAYADTRAGSGQVDTFHVQKS